MRQIHVDLDDTLEVFADQLKFILMEEFGVRMEKFSDPAKPETMVYTFEKAEAIPQEESPQ